MTYPEVSELLDGIPFADHFRIQFDLFPLSISIENPILPNEDVTKAVENLITKWRTDSIGSYDRVPAIVIRNSILVIRLEKIIESEQDDGGKTWAILHLELRKENTIIATVVMETDVIYPIDLIRRIFRFSWSHSVAIWLGNN